MQVDDLGAHSVKLEGESRWPADEYAWRLGAMTGGSRMAKGVLRVLVMLI